MRRRSLLAAAAALAARARAGGAGEAEAARGVVVFAAVSLSDALRAVAEAHRRRSGRSVVFSFAGSGDLARQIRAGAPAEVFVSADARRVDELEQDGLVEPGGRVDLVSNRLVVIVPEASALAPRRAADLAAVPRLALADPASVPAGAYAREWLERCGAWAAVRERVVPTLDVRAALAAVAAGNAAAGVVYATDAAVSPRVRVAFEVPAAEAPRIVYVAALVAGASAAARELFAYLRSPEARATFARFGFLPPPGA